MIKFTFSLLCFVATGVNVLSALNDEEFNLIRLVMGPVVAKCSAEHEVSTSDILTAKESYNADAVKPCFLECVFKKIHILDNFGYYDAENTISKLRLLVQNNEDFAKFQNVARKCSKVNFEPVSRENPSCDRAKLLLACAFESKDEIPFYVKQE